MKRTTRSFETPTRKTTNRSSSGRRFGSALGTLLAAGALTLPVTALLAHPGSAYAQRGPVQRSVEGTVQDSAGANIKGAVVYLKDTKSLSVKSFVSTDAGTFHFGQLSPDTDYDIWAETQGKKSKTKSISQFNSKNQFIYTLKIEN